MLYGDDGDDMKERNQVYLNCGGGERKETKT